MGHKSDRPNEAIVAAVIRMAHDLGSTVVAEGVETAGQHRELARLGADFCQGFYFARPMPTLGIGTLIEHRSDEANEPLSKLAAL